GRSLVRSLQGHLPALRALRSDAPSTVRVFIGRFMARCSLVSLLGSLGTTGCASIPKGRAVVNDVDFQGQQELSESELDDTLATRESPQFLGLFAGVVYDYEVFNLYVLGRDLQRVERYYRARGFYKARVRAGRVFYEDPKHVR